MMISIIIAKIIYYILRLFGRGATTLPGKIALDLKYNILNRLSKGVSIICVTGTNGKTTTCALLERAMKDNKLSYFINKSGANMLSGVATAFIVNSNIFGHCKKDYAILECDENSLPLISRYIDANVVVVTNVFRDQLDRYGEVNHTLSKIKQGIDYMPNSVVVLNADCPLTYSLSKMCNNKMLTFGITADFGGDIMSDNRFCPCCDNELKYHSRVYAQLGDYYCTHCGYHRIKPNVCVDEIAEINQNGSTFFVNGSVHSISLGGIYNIYNYICALAVLDALDINEPKSLCDFDGAFGRMERFKNGEQVILLMLVKNPVGLSNCIKYVSKIKGDVDLAFALNDNDADGRDVSWIWDADFKPLNVKNSFVHTVGLRSYDMAIRLKYDNINISEIIDGEKYDKLLEIIKNSNRDFAVLSTYTSMMNMRHVFINHFGGKEFWQ
jgi:UDP-N-acetylmuramyl tripeptide synthase